MAKTATMTIRVPMEVKQKLDLIARDTRRSRSFLAGEAVASYVELHEWQVELIRRRLEEVEKGMPTIPHAEVSAWLDSLGTKHELPMPKPKARRTAQR
jgi:predicted transcriptional regulator